MNANNGHTTNLFVDGSVAIDVDLSEFWTSLVEC